ncbi:MAG: hypothetical protein ACR2LA_05270 [Acidimicrobiales bacterium]
MFVCTGNICRSPMAEALLRVRAVERGIDVAVSSAGELFEDRPAEPAAVDAMARLDIDISGHRSRIWDAELVQQADLVVAMEQRHVHDVVVAIGAIGTTFTLPDLVARATAAGPRGDATVAEYLVMLARSWPPGTRVGGRDLDVTDPIGGPRRAFRRCADQLGDLLDELVPLAWPAGGDDTDAPPSIRLDTGSP